MEKQFPLPIDILLASPVSAGQFQVEFGTKDSLLNHNMFWCLQIGYSRPLQLTDLWRLEDERLCYYQSNLLAHNFYNKYTHIDAAYCKPCSNSKGTQTKTTKAQVVIDPNGDALQKISPQEEVKTTGLQTLPPMMLPVDWPGTEIDLTATSTGHAEKISLPNTDCWTWIRLLFSKKKSVPASVSSKKYHKSAARSHSMRLFWSCLCTVRQDFVVSLVARLVSRESDSNLQPQGAI